ncbi:MULTISPECIES: MDR family MFS transporter [Rodentibacter]|uniref:MDR family MFS transporter n=1 Tax=Rodentibacter TaxID=1960084 RepID=UPI0009860C87|nr:MULTISPECIES: MDR family MFS transporter [Rodentibacter]OOF39198.1 MFS transporter [Rodentibacter rarus]OOF52357.1 MFS transporter [Rodentibacter trehalosifermentans]
MRDPHTYQGLAWVAAMALFMQSLDATILNTALPAISVDLHKPAFEMQMAIIAYSLSVALFIPLTAWAAAKFGTLTVFRCAVFTFVLGSAACAAAPNLESLILARIIQGIGGAFMMPIARLAIIQSVPKHQLLNAWNLMATAGLIGPILGPILGGWLVIHATWHWIFLINIPIGIVGIWAAGHVMDNIKGSEEKLDWTGFLLFALGLVGLTLGLDLLGETHQNPFLTYGSLMVGIGLLMIYVMYAKGNERAILPLSLFRTRTFTLSILANLFIRLSASGIPFLLPLMFQLSFGFSAEMSGWLLAPIALMSVIFKTVIGHILNKFSYKTTLISSALLMALGIMAMAWWDNQTALVRIVMNLMWYGACMSMIFTAVNTLAVGDLSPSQAGAGSTILSIVQQVGIGFGIAASSIILNFYRQFFGNEGELLQHAFSYTFLTSSLFAIALICTLVRLHKTDGDHLRQTSTLTD